MANYIINDDRICMSKTCSSNTVNKAQRYFVFVVDIRIVVAHFQTKSCALLSLFTHHLRVCYYSTKNRLSSVKK